MMPSSSPGGETGGPEGKSPKADPGGAASVLVVDDRPEELQILKTVLATLGQRIVTCSSGQEALRLAFSEEFAVILLDARMPEMDGFETARYLRSRPKTRHTPIIFVTGIDETRENIQRGYAVGAVDCLFKPYLPEVLQCKVRFFLDLHAKKNALEQAKRKLELEIAYRKRVQAELLQGQKLQAIGQLAAGIAHEINNPTSYILSNLGTVREYLEELGYHLRDGRKPTARKPEAAGGTSLTSSPDKKLSVDEMESLLRDFDSALADCHTGAQRIQRIVKGLREFVHPDEAELREVDLASVLERAIELCSNELKYQVAIHRDIRSLPEVTCYPGQIEQVFVNLLVNAAQAMAEKNGDLFVEAGPEEGGVAIRIRDTGPGISPENQARLFQPFFTTKPVGKGTGLGLYVAYKIVRDHGGRIDVQSEAGKGAEFAVHIPLKRLEQDTEALGDKRVL
jgi:signal transduction histidine kinase